ncbi:MAG: NFACT family protein [Clostridiales bacterium]|nr:NFACT family protein [Clostridiales bacterium]
MPQDAFTIKYIASELKERLIGGKISKITQPSKDCLSFIIYTQNGSVKLETCLSAKGCRINLCKTESPAPKTAPSFCMLLRKHLQNAQITNIEQIEDERVIFLDFLCTSEFEIVPMRLYLELMGKYSNAALVKDGVILGALKQTAIGENTRRVLFSGVKYTLPAGQDKISPNDRKGLERLFENKTSDLAKFISDNIKGVAYSTALDIAITYGENATLEQIQDYLCGGFCEPCVIYQDGEPVDFKVRSADKSAKNYPSVLEAQAAFYAYITQKDEFELKKRRILTILNSALKKCEKRLSEESQKLLECDGADNIRLKGELLTANLYKIERGADKFEAVNYYDEAGGTITIALDKSLSPADNAQKFFRKYAKLKRTAASVSEQKAQTEDRLKYLNSIKAHLFSADCLCDLQAIEEELISCGISKPEIQPKKKKDEALPPRTYFVDGFKIISGRNNLQNDRLLKRLAPNDIWLHTQSYHSSHVGIITDGKPVPDEVLLVAAEICVNYSDGKSGGKIPVDYALAKFVKKPSGGAAGFVVYTDYKTLLAEANPHENSAQ